MRSRRDYYSNSKDYINRWVVSYADFTTLLLALFIFLFALNKMDREKLSDFSEKNNEINQTEKNTSEKLATEENNKLFETLKEKFKFNNNIEIIKAQNSTILRIKDTLLFDSGSCEIKENAKLILDETAIFLTDIENPIIIEGHTDSIPIKNNKFESNWELSTARATNIIKYLIKNYNINPSRLKALGLGEYSPIEENTTNIGREKNRRVDIIILCDK